MDGIPNNKRANSHLATLKSITHNIIHEGIPLDNFESDYYEGTLHLVGILQFCNILTAVGKDDINDQFDFDDNKTLSQTDNDDNSFGEADSHTGDVTVTPVEDFLQVNGDSPRHDEADACQLAMSPLPLLRNSSRLMVTDLNMTPTSTLL